jgi:hypothetical protein
MTEQPDAEPKIEEQFSGFYQDLSHEQNVRAAIAVDNDLGTSSI